MAIRNAFQRASATIIDANVTTLIAAIVLYAIGSDQVKGFAFTLGVGVVLSMFTSVFLARVIFDVAEKQKWLTEAKMKRLIGATRFDFMSLFKPAAAVSATLIVIGLVATFARGKGILDIDFTGGVSVQIQFRERQNIAYVRAKLAESDLPDVVVSDVRRPDEEPGLLFLINTSERDMRQVRAELAKAFHDQLVTNHLQVISLEAIPTAVDKAGDKTADKPEEATPKHLTGDKGDAPVSEEASEKTSAAAPAGDGETGSPDPQSNAPAPAAPKPASNDQPPPTEAETVASKVKDPFAGGTRAELRFDMGMPYRAVEELLKQEMEKLYGAAARGMAVNLANRGYRPGDTKAYADWTVKTQLPPAEAEKVFQAIEETLADQPFFPASSSIGAAVAQNTQQQAVFALVLSWICIVLYLWIRFQKVAFGVAAVIAIIHDVLVTLGAIALSYYIAPYLGFLMIDPFKINLIMVAAFLTVIGYSVNDTIVIFDRIREVRGKLPVVTPQMVNDSINQSLSRTLITSLTVLIVVIVMYIFGGDSIHGFTYAMLVGTIVGTYSSIYVASSLLLLLAQLRKKKPVAAPTANAVRA
jgi:SecD/SecF fusion protein